MDLNDILKDVITVAKQAGGKIMKYYQEDYTIKDKSAENEEYNPVTIADLESNKIIIKGLEKYGYGILSEESIDNEERLNKERVWIIDPMDGTSDFIDKTGEFVVMIGLVENNKVILGVVYNPPKDIVYYATINQGAFFIEENSAPEKLVVSNINNLLEVRMLTSRFHLSENVVKLFKDLHLKERIKCGSAGLKISLIAEARAECNINTSNKTKEWDVCAADIILSEAGGKLTDIRGEVFTYNKQDPTNYFGYIASNGIIHQEIVKSLKIV